MLLAWEGNAACVQDKAGATKPSAHLTAITGVVTVVEQADPDPDDVAVATDSSQTLLATR